MVKFSLDGKQMSGVLHSLSATGGVAQLPGSIQAGDLAELHIDSKSGTIVALVELLNPLKASSATMRAFRFVALDEQDQERLATVIAHMRNNGYGIS